MNDGVTTAAADIHSDVRRGSVPLPAPKTRSHRRRYLVAGVLLLLFAAGAAWWWIAGRGVAMHYTTTPVTRGTVARAVTATGTINPVLTIIVGTAVSGVIQSLQCDYNTKVTKGQICAKIDPRPFQAVVDQDKANLAVAKAQLAKDQANLEYTKANSGRTALLARENSIAQDTADQSMSAYHQGEAQILLDQATIQQWQAQLEGAQVNLDYTDIVSPVDGTVVSRNVTQGQTVAASLQTPTLFLIATDLTKMEVDTNVSESDIGSVKENEPRELHGRGLSRPHVRRAASFRCGRRRKRSRTSSPLTSWSMSPTPTWLLMPGMTATTKIVTAERDNVLRVPDQALRYVPAGAPLRRLAVPAPRHCRRIGAACGSGGPPGAGLGLGQRQARPRCRDARARR